MRKRQKNEKVFEKAAPVRDVAEDLKKVDHVPKFIQTVKKAEAQVCVSKAKAPSGDFLATGGLTFSFRHSLAKISLSEKALIQGLISLFHSSFNAIRQLLSMNYMYVSNYNM